MKTGAGLVAFGLGLGLTLLLASPASAQEPTGSHLLRPFGAIPPPPPPGSPSWSALSLFGEPTGDTGALPGYFASAPIRMSLQNSIFPIAGGYQECGTREESAGNSTGGGIPIQRYALLRLTPNLVLHGFSSAGCPIDAAIGVAITYAVPIRPTLWLVAGAGIYTAPAPAQLSASRTQSDFRIDLIKQVSEKRSLSVGVGKRGVTFGGVF